MLSVEHKGVLVHSICSFLEKTKNGATVREALIHLARSAWDERAAIARWMDPEYHTDIMKEESTDDSTVSEDEDATTAEGEKSEKQKVIGCAHPPYHSINRNFRKRKNSNESSASSIPTQTASRPLRGELGQRKWSLSSNSLMTSRIKSTITPNRSVSTGRTPKTFAL